MIKKIIGPAAALTIICVVVTALLAGTNYITKDIVAERAAATAEASRKQVLPAAASFEEVTIAEEENGMYAGLDAAGEVVGYVFETSGKGYGGAVNVMTGMTKDGEITAVTLVSHSETPGLGAKAGNDAFISQYQGAAPEGGFAVTKTAPTADNQVQAVTGATITSKAVTSAVNEAIELYETYGKGGGA